MNDFFEELAAMMEQQETQRKEYEVVYDNAERREEVFKLDYLFYPHLSTLIH